MGTVATGIGIGIGISLGSVETVLHIFIEANFIGIRIGVGIGIVVGQWKHTISHQEVGRCRTQQVNLRSPWNTEDQNFALLVTEFERTISYRRVRPVPVDDPQTVSGECGSGFYGSGGQAAGLPQLITGQARAQGPQMVSG